MSQLLPAGGRRAHRFILAIVSVAMDYQVAEELDSDDRTFESSEIVLDGSAYVEGRFSGEPD
jgi:hypothetical protein